MEPVLRIPEFENQSGFPVKGNPEEQQAWLSKALVEVIELAEALPYEPQPQHDLPARPIHR